MHLSRSAYLLNSLAIASTASAAVAPSSLDVDDVSSVQDVAKTLADGAMSYYHGTAEAYADLPGPYYWWELGALIGAMLDYSHYTKDTAYDDRMIRALLDNTGPNFNYMVEAHYGDEGNDDQAFWSFAVMSAAERNLPQPDLSKPGWLDMGENIWNSMVPRWNESHCGGGFFWQIFPCNANGMTYKNSVSNGGFFQLSARLARATGNNTYVEWAERVWDWSRAIDMVGTDFNVYDGASIGDNCTKVNRLRFTYSTGIYGYGAAVLANYTGDDKWADRTEGIFESAQDYFSPYDNATDIMYEPACETVNRCNYDMKSFKGYLSRFMFSSAVMIPSRLDSLVRPLLETSALAAGQACTGGADGMTCGEKWYVGGFDGIVGLGQEMCALETVHGLLASEATPPLNKDQIRNIRSPDDLVTTTAAATTTTATSTPTPTPTPTPSQSFESKSTAEEDGSKDDSEDDDSAASFLFGIQSTLVGAGISMIYAFIV